MRLGGDYIVSLGRLASLGVLCNTICQSTLRTWNDSSVSPLSLQSDVAVWNNLNFIGILHEVRLQDGARDATSMQMWEKDFCACVVVCPDSSHNEHFDTHLSRTMYFDYNRAHMGT